MDRDIPDRIEKRITLNAPVERVWRAISQAHEFGAWFGVQFDGPFVAGAAVTGRITPTTVDATVKGRATKILRRRSGGSCRGDRAGRAAQLTDPRRGELGDLWAIGIRAALPRRPVSTGPGAG